MGKRRVEKVVAGTLRHQIKIQQKVLGSDSDGGVTRTWTTLKIVWAGIDAGIGTENIHGQQTDSTKTFVFTMRFYEGLDPTMRFLLVKGGRVFNIVDVSNPMELGALMTVVCREDTSGADD